MVRADPIVSVAFGMPGMTCHAMHMALRNMSSAISFPVAKRRWNGRHILPVFRCHELPEGIHDLGRGRRSLTTINLEPCCDCHQIVNF
jgi:hypothetical protein